MKNLNKILNEILSELSNELVNLQEIHRAGRINKARKLLGLPVLGGCVI